MATFSLLQRRAVVVALLTAILLVATLLHYNCCKAELFQADGARLASDGPVSVTRTATDAAVAAAESDWQQYVPEQYRGYIQQQEQQQHRRDGTKREDNSGGGRRADDKSAEEEEELKESSEARVRARSRVERERERRVEEREDRSVERTHSGWREKLRVHKTERDRESERVDRSGHIAARSISREDGGGHDSEEDEQSESGGSSRERRHSHTRGRGGGGERDRSTRLASTEQLSDTYGGVAATATPARTAAASSQWWLGWLSAVVLAVGCGVLLALFVLSRCLSGRCVWQRCRERLSGYHYDSIKHEADEDDSEQLLR